MMQKRKNVGKEKGMIYALNAAQAQIIVDIAVVVVILMFSLSAAKKGFVNCLFSLIATIAAIVLAFVLAKPLLGWTNGLFGLQTTLQNACTDALSKVAGFDIDVSSAGIEAALTQVSLPTFLIDVVKDVGNSEVPIGTTLAMIVGQTAGDLIATLISWIVLFLITKLVLKLLQKILSSIVEKIPVVGALNHLLGAAVGLLQGFLIVCVVVAILTLIPIDGVSAFLSECTVLGWLYNNNPLYTILGWIIR